MIHSQKRNMQIIILALIAVIALVILAACVPVNATPASDISKTLLDLKATEAVVNEIARQQTAAAVSFTQAAQSTVAAQTQIAVQATATQVVRQTAAIQTLSVDQTKQAWTITEQAAYGLATATQDAVELQSTLDAAAVSAQSTAIFAQARTAENAADREDMINQVRAWTPYVAGGIILAVVIAVGVRFSLVGISRLRWIKRDERGDAPIRDDGRMVYDPDRNPGAALIDQASVLALGIALIKARTGIDLATPLPAIVDPKTTERDQMVDLATRGLPNAMQRKSIPPGLQRAMLQQPKYTVYDLNQQPPIDGDTEQALSQDWSDSQSWD